MAGLPRTLPELVKKAIAAALQDVHVALPGTVVRWDAAANLADVQVMVQHPVFDDDNGRTYEDLGTLLGVPVAWPRAGGYVLTLPMQTGDTGLLVFCSTAIGEWRSSAQSSKPADASRHSIGWPVFYPGLSPDVSPLAAGDVGAREIAIILGQDGAETQIRIGSSGILLGANANEHVMSAEATVLLIYNMFVQLGVAIGGPWAGTAIQAAAAAAMTAALTAQVAPAPAGAPAQVTTNTAAQSAISAGSAPVNTLFAAWVTQLAALATKVPDASGLFPSAGASLSKTE